MRRRYSSHSRSGWWGVLTAASEAPYHVAQQLIADDRPVIVLCHQYRYAGVDANLSGVQLFPDASLRVAFAQYT